MKFKRTRQPVRPIGRVYRTQNGWEIAITLAGHPMDHLREEDEDTLIREALWNYPTLQIVNKETRPYG